jgi:hypothetical protein
MPTGPQEITGAEGDSGSTGEDKRDDDVRN